MNEAAALISLLNGATVSVFGGLLSACFCGALDTRRKRGIFWLSMTLMIIAQGAACLCLDMEFWARAYPFIVHLPLLLTLRALTGRWLWPAFSIVSAYLFCEMRRWLALLAAAVLPGGEVMQNLAELAVTGPLLLMFLRYLIPAVRQLMEYPVKNQCQFGLIPVVYYGFDYVTRVYTDLLYGGFPVVMEFMPMVCCGAYMVFLLYNSAEERKRSHLRQIQDNLKLEMYGGKLQLAFRDEEHADMVQGGGNMEGVYKLLDDGITLNFSFDLQGQAYTYGAVFTTVSGEDGADSDDAVLVLVADADPATAFYMVPVLEG